MQQINQKASDAIHRYLSPYDLLITYFVPDPQTVVGVFRSPSGKIHVIAAFIIGDEWQVSVDAYDVGVEAAFKALAKRIN